MGPHVTIPKVSRSTGVLPFDRIVYRPRLRRVFTPRGRGPGSDPATTVVLLKNDSLII